MTILFRYPGGKTKIKKRLIRILDNLHNSMGDGCEYREPFFGGGSVGINFLMHNVNADKVWINDIDYSIASVWNSVIKYPKELIKLCDSFDPNVESFNEFKDILIGASKKCVGGYTVFEIAFMKIALHQMSYSGLGTKAGGPIGGVSQSSDYDIGCRWNAKSLEKKIKRLHELFSRVEVHNSRCSACDYEELFDSDEKYVTYLDPPYYDKGNDLYQCGFSDDDHVRLSKLLRGEKNPWLLSYDDCEEVRKLYSWAHIAEIPINYSIHTARKKSELAIVPKLFSGSMDDNYDLFAY